MLKNKYFRLGIIVSITLIAVLIALPRIPIKIQNKYLSIDSEIGGYYIELFGGKTVLDFRQLKRGLDLEGGVRVVLKADMSNIASSEKNSALESATKVIERRVNLLGVSEPYIVPSKIGDDYRIIVEIPGIADVTSAVNLIGQTAQLKFKVIKQGEEWDASQVQKYFLSPALWEDTNVTGADLRGADVVFSQQVATQNAPQIQLKFTDEGRAKFSELAKNNINKPIGLFLDEGSSPLSMPIVNPDLAKGLTNDPVITGNFDIKSANALSVQIRAGALPVPVSVLEQKTIGATLGDESVKKSFFAGAVGLLLVFMFLIFMYGRLGVMAGFALLIYSFLVLAIFKVVPVVLTLPGIAGFILSIGMATDANILVFERIKEEIIWGKPKNLAIKLGFDRAWNSIKDSNMSSLLTAAVLFYFGNGSVRGFAVTLAIGILVSLFTSIFVVKTFIEVFRFGYDTSTAVRKPKRLPKFLRRRNADN